jgi:hypothetical protein
MAFVTGTAINQPSATLVNTLSSISQKLIYPKVADLVFQPSPTFSFLNQYAKRYNAGAEIVYPLLTTKITTRGAYWGDQLLPTSAIDAIQPADQVWRGYFQAVTLPVMDIVIGRGGPVGLDLVKVYMQAAAGSMLDMLAEATAGNAPFNSSIDIDSINSWVLQTTNTVAGINRSTSTFWQPAANAVIGGHLSPTTLLPAYFTTTYGYDEPNLMILNNTDFANFELQFVATNAGGAAPSNIIRGMDNFTDTMPVQTSLRYHMRFKNAVVLADQHFPAGTGYLLNTKYIWAIYNLGSYFRMTPWIMPSNQDVITARIHLIWQLGCNRPLAQIALTSIS